MLYVSPLVATNEIDLSTTIQSVQTAVGIIVLRNTYKGPEKSKVLVTNEDELITKFGKPVDNTECVIDVLSALAFLKDANKLYCTRVMPVSASFAGTFATSGASASFVGMNDETAPILDVNIIDPDRYHEEAKVNNPYIMNIIASSRGAWGNNIRVAVLDKTSYDAIKNRSHSTWDIYTHVRKIDSPLSDAKNFLVIVQAIDQGKEITEANWKTVEVHNVSTNKNAVNDVGENIFVETAINKKSSYIRVAFNTNFVNTEMTGTFTSRFQQLSGGRDYYAAMGETNTIIDATIMNALDLYDNPEEIDVNIFIDANKSDSIKSYMISICENRKDAVAVLDCPKDTVVNNTGNETNDLCDWINLTFQESSSYAAVYGNWLEVLNKFSGKYVWIPASGYVAGIYARNDNMADPWYAPAGFNRGELRNIRRLAWNPKLGNRDILYMNRINPIVSFSGQGKIVLGQKNLLNKNSAFNRVNIRRLFITMEKAISTATTYFLFEPNNDLTRMMLVNMIEPFLRDVKARNGISDFLIVCDESNNTAERQDRGELWCDIYVKPVHAAEYIILNFVATKTAANFTEIANVMASE
jgi:phage tail sheath protein FI